METFPLLIFFLIFFRKKLKIKDKVLYIHLNLSISLLLGLVVFVAGVDFASRNTVSLHLLACT